MVSGLYNFVAPYLTHPAMSFFWSLSVEEQFYLLLPTMFVIAGTRHARVRAAAFVLLAVAVVIRPLFSPNHFALAHYSSQYRFDALAAGVVLGLERERVTALVLRLPKWLRRTAVFFSFVTLIYVSRHVDIWFAVHYGLVFIWAASACLIACAVADGGDVFDFPGGESAPRAYRQPVVRHLRHPHGLPDGRGDARTRCESARKGPPCPSLRRDGAVRRDCRSRPRSGRVGASVHRAAVHSYREADRRGAGRRGDPSAGDVKEERRHAVAL